MADVVSNGLVERGRALLKSRQFEAAVDCLKEAIGTTPTSAEAHDSLAAAYFLQGQFSEAAVHYTKVTLLKPMEGKAFFNLGAILNKQGEHQKAVEVIRKGIQRDKKCADGYYNLGVAHRKLGQHAMAASAYKEAIRINPKFAEAYQNLGNVYIEMQNLMLAVINFKKALEIRPDFERARAGLDKAQGQQQVQKNAISPFGRLVDTTQGTNNSAPAALDRELTESERTADREQLRVLCAEIEKLTKTCRDGLSSTSSVALRMLARTVAEGDSAEFTLTQVSREFRKSVEKTSEARRQMKRKILELRAHEELMTAEDLTL